MNRHVVEDNGGQPGAARGCCAPVAGSGTGSRCRCGWPPAARSSPLLHRKTGARPVTTPAERAALLPHFADDIALLQEVTGERVRRLARRGPTRQRLIPTSP